MKRCVSCKLEKDIEAFFHDRNRKDGYDYYCKECKKPYQKNERTNQLKYKWVKKNPNKVKAYREVVRAITKGTLSKQPCEICKKKEVQAHHDDYKKPLTIRWLCTQHHAEWHRNNKAKI